MQNTSFLKKHSILSLLFGIALVIMGIVICCHDSVLITVVLSLGLILSGLSSLRMFFLLPFATKNIKMVIVFRGIISILLGIIALIYTREATTLIFFIMGAQMAVSGIISLSDVFLLRKWDFQVSSLVLDGVFSLAIALILFLFPTFVSSTIGLCVGILMIVAGLGILVWAILIMRADRAFRETNVEGTAEIRK